MLIIYYKYCNINITKNCYGSFLLNLCPLFSLPVLFNHHFSPLLWMPVRVFLTSRQQGSAFEVFSLCMRAIWSDSSTLSLTFCILFVSALLISDLMFILTNSKLCSFGRKQRVKEDRSLYFQHKAFYMNQNVHVFYFIFLFLIFPSGFWMFY